MTENKFEKGYAEGFKDGKRISKIKGFFWGVWTSIVIFLIFNYIWRA